MKQLDRLLNNAYTKCGINTPCVNFVEYDDSIGKFVLDCNIGKTAVTTHDTLQGAYDHVHEVAERYQAENVTTLYDDLMCIYSDYGNVDEQGNPLEVL